MLYWNLMREQTYKLVENAINIFSTYQQKRRWNLRINFATPDLFGSIFYLYANRSAFNQSGGCVGVQGMYIYLFSYYKKLIICKRGFIRERNEFENRCQKLKDVYVVWFRFSISLLFVIPSFALFKIKMTYWLINWQSNCFMLNTYVGKNFKKLVVVYYLNKMHGHIFGLKCRVFVLQDLVI